MTAAAASGAVTGAEITLTGTNFIGTKSVTIGGVPAPVLTVVSATSLKVIVPPGASGSAPIIVTNNRGGDLGLRVHARVELTHSHIWVAWIVYPNRGNNPHRPQFG